MGGGKGKKRKERGSRVHLLGAGEGGGTTAHVGACKCKLISYCRVRL